MTKDRWTEIQTIFELAIKRDATERVSFLNEKCSGDQELFKEVLSLLEADEDIPDILTGIAIDSFNFDDNPDLEGKQIGAYKIIKRLADGGMGSVYLADRSDGHFERRVALKVIKKGYDSEQLIRRFNRERQILARLHHPNIARLYDGGLTPDGRPYFTMEFVDGLPIDHYCDMHKLNINARLQLMLIVLETISYAHRNLIIHRDLKPGNIFITSEGKVKLLDFGIAHLIDENETDLAPITHAGQHVLTPEYAAPEQLRGQQASVASDVYQIGVVLYELIKGQRPFDLKGKTINEIEQILNSKEPEKLSFMTDQIISERADLRQATVKDYKNLLSKDLERITAKTLSLDAGLRYLTCDALREDLENYLDGRPVKATTPSFNYKAIKFVKRNRTALSIISLIIIIIISLSTYYTIQLTIERDKAKAEAEKSMQIASFMSSIFEEASPEKSRGRQITAQELLDSGTERIQKDLSEQPEIRSALLHTIGNVYINLGLYDRAEPLIKESLALRKSLPDIIYEEISESLSSLGKLYYEQGKYDSSEVIILRKIQLSKKLYPGNHPDLALGYNDLAWILLEKGDYYAADSINTLALMMRKDLFGYEHVDVAESISNLGSTNYGLGNLDQAEKLYQESLSLRKKLLGNDHPLIAQNYNNLGLINEDKELYTIADSFYTLALKLNIKLYGEISPQVAWSYQDLSRLAGRQNQFDKAIKLVRKSNKIREETLGKDHIMLAYSLDYLGDAFLYINQLDSAIIYYEKSIDIYQQADSSTWIYMASPLKGLGQTLMKKGLFSDAEKYLRRALYLRESNLPPGNYVIARAKTALAECLIKMKRFSEAEKFLLSAEDIFKKLNGQYTKSYLQTLQTLVNLYADWKKETRSAHYKDEIKNLKS